MTINGVGVHPGTAKGRLVNALKVMRLMQRSPYSAVSRVRIDPDLATELTATMHSYITYILERELRSAHFVKSAAEAMQ